MSLTISTSRTEETWRDNIRGSSGADWKRTAEAMRELCFTLEKELGDKSEKAYADGYVHGRWSMKPKAEDAKAEDAVADAVADAVIVAEEVAPNADV